MYLLNKPLYILQSDTQYNNLILIVLKKKCCCLQKIYCENKMKRKEKKQKKEMLPRSCNYIALEGMTC